MVKSPPRLYVLNMPYFPDQWAVVAGHGRAAALTGDGEFLAIEPGTAAKTLAGAIPLVIHAPATLKRLGNPAIQVLDILELFGFVCPAQSAAPTPAGLARFLDMNVPNTLEDAAAALAPIAEALLAKLALGRDLPAKAFEDIFTKFCIGK